MMILIFFLSELNCKSVHSTHTKYRWFVKLRIIVMIIYNDINVRSIKTKKNAVFKLVWPNCNWIYLYIFINILNFYNCGNDRHKSLEKANIIKNWKCRVLEYKKALIQVLDFKFVNTFLNSAIPAHKIGSKKFKQDTQKAERRKFLGRILKRRRRKYTGWILGKW